MRFAIAVLLIAGCAGPTATRGDAGAADAPNIVVSDAAPDAAHAIDAAPVVDAHAAIDAASAVDAARAPIDAAVPAQVGLLHDANGPMPCADPAVVSEGGADATFYVFCTSMSHVWRTSDWAHFTNERANTTFDLAGMSANGRQIGSWWAPGVVYAPGVGYVMWVSVPDAQGTDVPGNGWDTRSIAVLTATAPLGPWVFRGLAIDAAQVGEHFIDPFLFRDTDGSRYVFYKRYGGGITSRIMGARVGAGWNSVVLGSTVEIMDGYGGGGAWELNVRENPAVIARGATHHLVYSGAHWADDSYATGHAVSSCGPLCIDAARGGWHSVSSGDRGVVQVVQANGDPNFTSGGPGGAVFETNAGDAIVYAAAARSAHSDSTRYLMRDPVRWANGAPYVDTAHHHPTGL